ncbi:WAP domain containing protein, SLPI-like [Trichuris trichiura]|uniref:WAP domain containing protein, SLPI-like n=1 Tax=Trichuris trichiura TaxID=36087 RepID=A0A077Z7S7_TRITR|nr:WAP domain containing protein, SLPI-like [Trichuris trichiura]
MKPCRISVSVLMYLSFASSCLEAAVFVKAGLCPLPAEDPLPNGISRCNHDNDCDGKKKCCPTIIGRACMLPDSDRVLCPDGKTAERTCSDDDDCPQKPTEKPGRCPSLVTPERWSEAGDDHCNDDDECQGSRKCCKTLLGSRCLLPILK